MSQRRRMGPTPRMRPVPAVRPVHAGSLVPWDRLAFAALFAVMAAFIVVVVVLSAHSSGHGRPSGSAGGQPATAGHGARNRQALAGGAGASATWNRRLATALAPVLRGRDGRLAVGVIDRSTGATAVYGAQLRFRTAGIVRAAILAALRLKNQGSGAAAGGRGDVLATQMIEAGDADATTRLWRQAGGAAGIAAADTTLGLRHTTPGPASSWGQTTTTAGDQLTLLTDLTAAASPLPAAARAYELGLMGHASADQQWGVPAAASPGSGFAVAAGSRAEGTPRRWAVNSIGMVERGGHQLLLAVLSDGQPSAAAGMAEDRAAAVAAARCMTAAG